MCDEWKIGKFSNENSAGDVHAKTIALTFDSQFSECCLFSFVFEIGLIQIKRWPNLRMKSWIWSDEKYFDHFHFSFQNGKFPKCIEWHLWECFGFKQFIYFLFHCYFKMIMFTFVVGISKKTGKKNLRFILKRYQENGKIFDNF